MLFLQKYAAEAWVAVAFVLSRILYYAAGIRYEIGPIDHFWQMLDPVLLRKDLLRSLYWMHMQPPGFNLLVGTVVKGFPESYGLVLNILFLAGGLVAAILTVRLMKRLHVTDGIAAVLAIIFVVSPGCVFNENLVSYDYPVMILLVCAAAALYKLCATSRVLWSVVCFASILALFYIRNVFHLAYIVLVAGVLSWFMPHLLRVIWIGAAPAFAAAAALYLKNWLLFGVFTGSTWMGMTTGVVTTYQMTPDEIDRLVTQGVLTPIARIPPFSDLNLYLPYIQLPAKTGLPVLDDAVTSTGHSNFNALGYFQVHEQFLRNSKAVLLHYPTAYLRSCAIAWFAYFLPAGDMHYYDASRAKLGLFDRVYSAVFYGKFREASDRKQLRAIKASGNTFSLVLYTGLFLMIILPLTFCWGLAQLVFRRFRSNWTQPEIALIAFLVFNIAFVTATSNLLSSFENNRYRFPLDPFFTVLLAALLTQTLRARHKSNKTAVSANN